MMEYLTANVNAIQDKPEPRLRSEVMDELNVAVRVESWSLMLDESERGHYSPGDGIICTTRQTQVKSVLNLQTPQSTSGTHNSLIASTTESEIKQLNFVGCEIRVLTKEDQPQTNKLSL